MTSNKLVDASKFLSYVLRHEPQAIGLSLDSEGWGSLDVVIAGATQQGRMLSRELVEQAVATSDKKRFELSADGQRIRAVQGHSTRSVDREFEPKQPPDILFHGTRRVSWTRSAAKGSSQVHGTTCIYRPMRRPRAQWASATARRWCCAWMPRAFMRRASSSTKLRTGFG
jgi:putative RNA 2'-phosphotransferase